jgi:hypothetical protein
MARALPSPAALAVSTAPRPPSDRDRVCFDLISILLTWVSLNTDRVCTRWLSSVGNSTQLTRLFLCLGTRQFALRVEENHAVILETPSGELHLYFEDMSQRVLASIAALCDNTIGAFERHAATTYGRCIRIWSGFRYNTHFTERFSELDEALFGTIVGTVLTLSLDSKVQNYAAGRELLATSAIEAATLTPCAALFDLCRIVLSPECDDLIRDYVARVAEAAQ